MDNREAARALFGVAGLLEAQGANPYRVRAYRRVARGLMRLPAGASQPAIPVGELDLPGLGPRLRRKLGELVTTGRMAFQDEVVAQFPPAVRELIAVPGIGPKTAQKLVGQLEIGGLDGLARAARQGRLRRLRGIGPVLERKLGAAAEGMLLSEAA